MKIDKDIAKIIMLTYLYSKRKYKIVIKFLNTVQFWRLKKGFSVSQSNVWFFLCACVPWDKLVWLIVIWTTVCQVAKLYEFLFEILP